MKDQGKSLKVPDLAPRVLEALDKARPDGMYRKHQVARLLGPSDPELRGKRARQLWVSELRAKIARGQQLVVTEGLKLSGEALLSTHVPETHLEALREASEPYGITSCSRAARLVILDAFNNGFRGIAPAG